MVVDYYTNDSEIGSIGDGSKMESHPCLPFFAKNNRGLDVEAKAYSDGSIRTFVTLILPIIRILIDLF